MSEKRRISRTTAVLGLAAVAGMVAGAIAVYVMQSGDGNLGQLAADCAGAVDTARRIEPLVKGEIAGFRTATEPESFADLSFRKPDGGETTLAGLGGKAALVNLWATWCAPCRIEMPSLDRLQATLGSDAFEVVAINIDIGSEERAKAFLAEIGVKDLAFYSDPSTSVFKTLKGRGLAFGLPTTILVDGKGCRIGVLQGPAHWDSEEAKALIGAAIAPG